MTASRNVKNRSARFALATSGLIAAMVVASPTDAATLVDASFVSTLNSGASVDTTGADIVDWGYFVDGSSAINGSNSNAAFNTLSGTNYLSGGGSMAVTTTAITSSSNLDADKKHTFTFTDGNSPTSGTGVATGSAFGSWGSSETGSLNFNFTDLGLGTHIITLYVGHRLGGGSNGDTRVFDMDYSWTASDGNVTGTVRSNDLGTVGGTSEGNVVNSVFTLEIENTVDALADLALTWDSVSGDAGEGFISGYTVETIPEPGSLALMALGGLLIALRRRRD